MKRLRKCAVHKGALCPCKKGSCNPAHKLMEDDVELIKCVLRNHDLTQVAIAKIYGVTPCAISFIHTGKYWKHVK